jgi:tRNA threonylcarbamoyladenosine biosynthesis protein TsaE
MSDHTLSLDLQNAEETSQAARALGAALTAGDTILLTGDVGAGKTHFARSLIQSMLTTPEDVPSPTFTLVQTYDTSAGAIWHADLYRLTSTFEIEELGLSDAFQDAVCLVEWPDRLGELKPDGALEITLETTGEDGRVLTASWEDDKWVAKLKSWRK